MSITKPDYDKAAINYDAADDSGAEVRDHTNEFLESILKRHGIQSVLDVSCGTGSQVFHLIDAGYQVVGSDLSKGMLAVAQRKADEQGVDVELIHSDMCTVQAGKFDAAISLFNSVAHLEKSELETTLQNIHSQLNPNGLFIFDNFNPHITDELVAQIAVDAVTELEDKSIRKVQVSTFNKETGVMTMDEEEHVQPKTGEPEVKKWSWTMQTYAKEWLEELFDKHGFELIECYGPHGQSFHPTESLNMLLVARRKP